MRDFWFSSGHHLLDRGADGRLVATDEFLKAFLARPELMPPPDACLVERTLHATVLADPRRHVGTGDIAAIADADARENWALMIAFRDRIIACKTIEATYLDLMRRGAGSTPPLFIDQVIHLILRNALDGCEDVFMLRAAELFFRPQRLTSLNGSLIAADEETVAGAAQQTVSPLVAMLGLPAIAEIDVLNDDNAHTYWARSDRFDMALDLTAGRRGLSALGQVLVRWIAHLLGVEIAIEPLIEVKGVKLAWYVGLDAQATRIGDTLWNSEALDEVSESRLIGLYRLAICDPELVLDAAKGEPIYLILAMAADGTLRMKPQNLVTGLPIRYLEQVS